MTYVPAPNYPTPNYQAFGDTLGNLANTYRQGQQQNMTLDQENAFKTGVPMTAGGQPDYAKIMQTLVQKGDINALSTIGPLASQQGQAGQAQGVISDFLGGGSSGSGGAPSPAGGGSGGGVPALPKASGPVDPNQFPKPDPSQFPNSPSGHEQFIRADAAYWAAQKGLDPAQTADIAAKIARAEGNNSVGWKTPNEASTVDVKSGEPFSFGDFQDNVRNGLGTTMRKNGIDPADPKQWAAADDYSIKTMVEGGLGPWKGDAEVNSYGAAQRAAGFPPSVAGSSATPPAPKPQSGAQPNIQLPQGGGSRPQQAPSSPYGGLTQPQPVVTAQNSPQPQQSPQSPQQRLAAAMQGQPVAQPAPQPQGQPAQPIGFQPKPLPGTNSIPESIEKIDKFVAANAANPAPQIQSFVKALQAKREEYIKSLDPVKVTGNETLLNPQTGQPVYKGANVANAGNGLGPQALDLAAENYYQTGKLPPNMGRGAQGASNINAIIERAASLHPDTPAEEWSARWQDFATSAAGKRMLSTRTASLELAENEAKSLIPRVRDASKAVNRTQYPSLNKVIEMAQMGEGDPNIVRLGIAAESLVNVYARVLNPIGAPTQSDKDNAHAILDKAWSQGQIDAALDQMSKEIASAKSSLDTTHEGMSAGGGKKDKPDAAPAQSAPASGSIPAGWSVVVKP